jgi:hypothetical protein
MELPDVCFKCLYSIILTHEGRHTATKYFTVAKSELQSTRASRDLTQGRVKRYGKRVLHELSEGMRDVGIMQGPFYDYYVKGSSEASLEGTKVRFNMIKEPQLVTNQYENQTLTRDENTPERNQDGYHTLYYSKKASKDRPFVVSIAREGAVSAMQPSSPDDMAYIPSIIRKANKEQNHSHISLPHTIKQSTRDEERVLSPLHLRKKAWREEFSDKLDRKLQSITKP